MAIKKLDNLLDIMKDIPPKRIVVAFGHDAITIRSVKQAIERGFAKITLVGDEDAIRKNCLENDIDPAIFEIVHETDEMESGRRSISMLNEGRGDVLMKGVISTDNLLRCILDKQNGLMIPGKTLTHISIAEIPNYHKLLIFTDAAFIPVPTIGQKIDMTRYVIETARAIGVERPKVSIISFSEKTNPKIQSAIDGAFISKMSERGQIKHADIDGPLSIDLSIDPESLRMKKVKSCVEGNADCLVFPFLEVGNVFFKSLTYFAKAEIATYIVGTKVPTTLSSRVDTEKSKLYSMAFACLMAERRMRDEDSAGL